AKLFYDCDQNRIMPIRIACVKNQCLIIVEYRDEQRIALCFGWICFPCVPLFQSCLLAEVLGHGVRTIFLPIFADRRGFHRPSALKYLKRRFWRQTEAAITFV